MKEWFKALPQKKKVIVSIIAVIVIIGVIQSIVD